MNPPGPAEQQTDLAQAPAPDFPALRLWPGHSLSISISFLNSKTGPSRPSSLGCGQDRPDLGCLYYDDPQAHHCQPPLLPRARCRPLERRQVPQTLRSPGRTYSSAAAGIHPTCLPVPRPSSDLKTWDVAWTPCPVLHTQPGSKPVAPPPTQVCVTHLSPHSLLTRVHTTVSSCPDSPSPRGSWGLLLSPSDHTPPPLKLLRDSPDLE